jgi:glycerate 2-kinase
MTASLQSLRQDAITLFQAGVAAADPQQAVTRCLHFANGQLTILDPENGLPSRTGRWNKIHLIAFGKAACAMAKAAHQIIPAPLLSTSIAVTNYENTTRIENCEVFAAAHPLPDEAGLKAAHTIAERLTQTQPGDLVLIMVSGGGSALLPYPSENISLQDKIDCTNLLLSSGANINQINCVRKHLSQLKGGGLARLSAPADVHAIILSDVLGDDLSAIASGPTVPDDTCFSDAIAILRDKNIWAQMPQSVREHLQRGERGEQPETPKSDDPIFHHAAHTLIGSNKISVTAMLNKAQELGYATQLYSDHLHGEARLEAEKLVLTAKQLQQTISQPTALIAGGETTVTLTGSGLGGRNQEMALAFALSAKEQEFDANWVFLSGGTDGRDGPTDAAGGLVDPGTTQRIEDAYALLNNNDSYHALKQAQDLLNTGATGTNVADLQVLLIQPTL